MDRVTESWSRTSGTMPFAERTAEVHKDLHDWDRTVLKSPQRRLKSLKEELGKL